MLLGRQHRAFSEIKNLYQNLTFWRTKKGKFMKFRNQTHFLRAPLLKNKSLHYLQKIKILSLLNLPL